jgi:hypothetical protein
MKIIQRFWPGLLVLLALGLAFEAADRAGVPRVAGFVAPAAAVVGRPLTPVSYAGAARRTARRCTGGAYNC